MADLIINTIGIIAMVFVFLKVERTVKKKTSELHKIFHEEIESNNRVAAALDRNTTAIRESDLEYEYGASKKELINKLKDAWISDQANQKETTPFIEWLVKEVTSE